MRATTVVCAGTLAVITLGAVVGSWRATLAGENEPGERLFVSGRVFKADGRTPAAKTRMMFYQADKNGIYGTRSGSPSEIARLRGSLVTGPEGQYEVWTIRPGAYPNGRTPAHIHYVITNHDGSVHHDALEFSDDPLVDTSKAAGAASGAAFAQMQTPVKDAKGVWRVQKDVLLKHE